MRWKRNRRWREGGGGGGKRGDNGVRGGGGIDGGGGDGKGGGEGGGGGGRWKVHVNNNIRGVNRRMKNEGKRLTIEWNRRAEEKKTKKAKKTQQKCTGEELKN